MSPRALCLLLLAACAARPDPEPPAAGAPRPPNVVIVLADDLGYGDLGCYGAERIRTPNLDRLAREGARFTDFYVAQAVCSASRAALHTGCYPNRIGIAGALMPTANLGIHERETTLGELVRARGYATAMFGKWHLGHHPEFLPTHHGYDEFFGIPYSNDMHPGHPEQPKAHPPLPLIEGDRTVEVEPDQRRFTTEFTARAAEFVRSHAERPFLIVLAHPMPHVPLAVSAAGAGRSAAGLYGDVIEEIDAGVGVLRDALAEAGVLDDTLFVFVSDNGPWLAYGDHAGSSGPLREGKGTSFEGGVRVPCIVRYPRLVRAGCTIANPCMTLDLFPTVAELSGAPLPPLAIDGRSLVPILRGDPGAGDPHEALFFWYHANSLEAMRAGRWKLHFPRTYRTMHGRAPGRAGRPGSYDTGARIGLALFDLVADPGETRDLAAAHPDVVTRLQAMAEPMRAELGDDAQKVAGRARRPAGRVQR
ncbi:MAG: sulfatase [Planctomycetes bacterium]|nr:sulfatase [Planctomycetota bacterium]